MRRAASSTPSLGEYSSWSTETEDTGQSLHPPTHRVFREAAREVLQGRGWTGSRASYALQWEN